MSAARIASMRLYYGLVNKYASGKAKNIELKSPEDEIIVLGKRFKAGLLADEESDDYRARGNSLGEPSKIQGTEKGEAIGQSRSDGATKLLLNVGNEPNYALPDPNMLFELKKNKSDSLIGMREDLIAANESLNEALAYIACFTYRAKWGEPIRDTKLYSDAGWGCMIRVGQMAFFNCIIKDQLLRDEDFLEDRLKFLLLLFNDYNEGELAPFSIKNIVPLAYEKFNIPMGNWFRSTSIMMALDQLNKKFEPRHISHIKMVTMLDATFLLSRLFEAFTEKSSIGMDESSMFEELNKPWGDKRLIITLTCMLGMDKPQMEYQKCLNFLISQPTSVGILGGSDNRAYYIIGYNKTKKVYYYLDPHTVQVPLYYPRMLSLLRVIQLKLTSGKRYTRSPMNK